MTALSIFVCLRWRIYIQSTTWFIGRVMSRPNTSWTGLLPLVVCYIGCTTKAAAARIPIHVSASYTYVSCRLYVRKIFPSTWCILSTVSFACGFPWDAVLVIIPSSFSINIFLNSWPRNSPPQSYVISTGHGYQTSHIVSTKFAIVVDFLLWYFVT